MPRRSDDPAIIGSKRHIGTGGNGLAYATRVYDEKISASDAAMFTPPAKPPHRRLCESSRLGLFSCVAPFKRVNPKFTALHLRFDVALSMVGRRRGAPLDVVVELERGFSAGSRAAPGETAIPATKTCGRKARFSPAATPKMIGRDFALPNRTNSEHRGARRAMFEPVERSGGHGFQRDGAQRYGHGERHA